MSVIAIIQARMGSSRLPGKVLLKIEGKPMLWHVVHRLKHSRLINKVIVATTDKSRDNIIEEFCKKNKIETYRGNETDVLDRYYCAALFYKANTIVRITSDCPFIDPVVVDNVISRYLDNENKYDGASNVIRRTYPRGLDTEVFSFNSLKKVWSLAKRNDYREHVSKYIYEHPEDFSLCSVEYKKDYSYLRWTVDEKEDYSLTKEIYRRLYNNKKIFHFKDILTLIESKPELSNINSHIKQKI